MQGRTPGLFVPVACLKGNAVINLTSPSAVSWPAPPSAAVAPVSAVPAVPALSGAGSESRTGPRSGEGGRGHSFSLPGQRTAPGQTQDPGDANTVARPATTDQQAQAAQRQAELEAHAAREREKQAMEHLKDVLTNVWQASAAVVDRALGRETPAPGTRSDTAPDLSQVAASLISRRIMAPPAPVLARPATQASAWADNRARNSLDASSPSDVQAYDAQGHSSAMPLETGSVFSRRV